MRALNPHSDYELHSNAQEIEAATAEFQLYIDDLITSPVVVDGHAYTLKVDVWLKRDGEDGKIEIDSMVLSNDLYMILAMHDELVKLDSSHYLKNNKFNFKRLERAIDHLAITKAKASNDWEMV